MDGGSNCPSFLIASLRCLSFIPPLYVSDFLQSKPNRFFLLIVKLPSPFLSGYGSDFIPTIHGGILFLKYFKKISTQIPQLRL